MCTICVYVSFQTLHIKVWSRSRVIQLVFRSQKQYGKLEKVKLMAVSVHLKVIEQIVVKLQPDKVQTTNLERNLSGAPIGWAI